jgi:zinc protease
MKSSFLLYVLMTLGWLMLPHRLNAELPEGAADMTTLDAIETLQRANARLSRTVLDNGMICLVKEDSSAPVVAIQIWVGTGSIHENEYLGAGISHGIEHMIFKGTEKRKPTDITRDIDGAGGNINAYTSFDRTVFHVEMPADKWRVGLDVLSDAVQHATYPEAEWLKEREVIIREIEMGRDDPDRVVSYLLWSTAYREHPYRYPVIGYEEVFSKLERSDLAEFASKRYHPDNMIVVVVGDIKRAEVEKEISDAFKGFDRKRSPPVVLPVEPAQAATRHARKVGDYKLARMEWAYHTVDQSHPDTPALDVLAIIVGGGDSSRLVRKIKEDQQLAISVNAYSYTPKSSGLFGISVELDPAREIPLTDALQKEVASWCEELFTTDEIAKARRQILSSELSPLQTMTGQAGNYGSGEFYAGDPRFAEAYLKKIAEVTPEQLRDVARRYFTPENLTTVVLSPLEEAGLGQAALAASPVSLPGKIELDSGVRLLVRENKKLPFVYISVSVGGGVITETSEQSGVTKLMSGMLVRGTATMDRQGIAEAVESAGASMAPYSGNDDFGIK